MGCWSERPATMDAQMESRPLGNCMKTLGMIGGIAPGSTIEYYRQLIAGYRERDGSGNLPPIVINSINLKAMLDLVADNERGKLTEYLLREIEKLARAGANFGLLASNTPHLVFDDLRSRSPIPLISIVEVTRDAAHAQGLKKVALFGTRFTMQASFYPEVLGRSGIAVALPMEAEQIYIHDKYMSELVNGNFTAETRAGLLEIVDQMKARDSIDGVILGGTELPLILRDPEYRGVSLLDTTRIHVKRAIAEMLS